MAVPRREYDRQYRRRNGAAISKRRAELRKEKISREGHGADRTRWHRSVHGPGFAEDFARMWDQQQGCCYLCGDEMTREQAVVDHDHRCCPPKRSCDACRRGLACQRCNRLIGAVQDDVELLRHIASNLERADAAARVRIAAKPTQLEIGESPVSLVDSPADGGSVQDMTTPSHARTTAGTPGLGAAWAILIGAGATSIVYNVTHAVHGGALNIGLALVYGIAPVYVSALLSHVVAVHGGGRFMQGITFVLMLGAMALSIGATAAVVQPVAGAWMQWLFGIVIDGAALVALRVILSSRHRKAGAAALAEQARAEAQEAAARADTAEHKLSAAAAELVTVRGELETALQALASARNRKRSSGQKRRASSPPNKTAASPLKPDVPDDVDTQAEALRILGDEPGISGGALGRRLGKSERYGCMLKARLAASVAGPDVGEQQ